MEENISERSGFVRLALGTGLTACGIAHLAKESGNRGLGALFVAAGAMKVAEGIFLYCPTKAFINSNVKNAVSTTFDEYLDGDSIMQQFNQSYESRWGTGNSSNSTSQSSSSGSSTMQNFANAASQVAQTVSNVAPSGTMANTASQVAKTVADTVSGNQSNQNNNQSNNQSNNQNSNQSGSNNSTKSKKSVINPS
ncbi:hypothetical protein ACH0B5_11975 [Ureibacillus sp. 179-F W5.1 NHS]|uniref:hypothetical protein n=1 Tax=Ureibacillus sp. 179-F W5.1 NHS TaxID=3374297 RepID=UPI0038793CBB